MRLSQRISGAASSSFHLQPEPDEADGFLPVKRWILCENPVVDEFELSGTEDRFQGVSLIPYHEFGRRSCHLAEMRFCESGRSFCLCLQLDIAEVLVRRSVSKYPVSVGEHEPDPIDGHNDYDGRKN
jgi:hypothetical protein